MRLAYVKMTLTTRNYDFNNQLSNHIRNWKTIHNVIGAKKFQSSTKHVDN